MRLLRSGALGLVVLLLIASLTAACSRGDSTSASAGDVNVEINVTPDPPAVGPAVVEVLLTDADGEPVEGAEVEIEGNMSHAGMEPVIVDASGGQDGRYISENFEFTMGGDWIITVSGTLPDGEEFEHVIDLTGVSG